MLKLPIPPQASSPVSRRELLKALSASGGALLAAAFLPGQWARPAIEAGVLPAHAQASCIIPVELVEPIGGCNECPYGNAGHISYPAGGPIPISAEVYYGGVWVPSALKMDAPGFVYVTFALPATPPPSNIVEFILHFDNGCSGSVSGPYK